MTQHFIAHRDTGGICRLCDHDLVTAKDGQVYCSNSECVHRRRPHPTRQQPNTGRKAEA
jgi:hypothetical protein